ncbi:hypothetical protein AMATHDRAFT_46898 [Amanita thiersii Skay4041]|uniref:Jacalin-type lectin domain-containing protein n=1 Tax=Amanita thiersii Skay4041 TaxID=703135 RepID=A0A2A9NMF6_9AGAR|nr:hypothetical protein AMATHDRAFT_46898 [Amanita thiersii Skay4041]
MLPFSFLCFLALVVSSIVALATPTSTIRFNPTESEFKARQHNTPGSSLSQLEARQLTNAQRLARGYPLKPPIRRSLSLKKASRSGLNATLNGYLQVSENGQVLGYVSKRFNKQGEYGILTDKPGDYLSVSLESGEAVLGNADISTVNGPLATFPFFGGMTGFTSTSSDLNPGVSNYIVFGGVVQRPPHSTPAAGRNSFTDRTGFPTNIESAIFVIDKSTFKIKCRWVNSDGKTVEPFLGYHGSEWCLQM